MEIAVYVEFGSVKYPLRVDPHPQIKKRMLSALEYIAHPLSNKLCLPVSQQASP